MFLRSLINIKKVACLSIVTIISIIILFSTLFNKDDYLILLSISFILLSLLLSCFFPCRIPKAMFLCPVTREDRRHYLINKIKRSFLFIAFINLIALCIIHFTTHTLPITYIIFQQLFMMLMVSTRIMLSFHAYEITSLLNKMGNSDCNTNYFALAKTYGFLLLCFQLSGLAYLSDQELPFLLSLYLFCISINLLLVYYIKCFKLLLESQIRFEHCFVFSSKNKKEKVRRLV